MRSPTRIIAEIGTAHGGDLVRARELIHAAAESGADTAKFQLVRADEILHPLSGNVMLPGGAIPLYERFRELERDEEFYAELLEECRSAGISFLCTPFGIGSARMLKRLNVDTIKIASPELNHFPLLKEVRSYGIPLILSAGIATLADIAETVSFLGESALPTLLHCITAYPAPEEEYNLKLIPHLSSLLGIPVGLSDHSMDPVLVPSLAALSGASIIEKHITLSRKDRGLDDPIALEPRCFREMVDEVGKINDTLLEAESIGPVELREREITLHKEIRKQYGDKRVLRVLGTGKKDLAPSEQRNYGFTNRSIHALHNLSPGEKLSSENCAILRSEKNLSPGLHPRFWEVLMGRSVTEPLEAGQGIRWDHLLS